MDSIAIIIRTEMLVGLQSLVHKYSQLLIINSVFILFKLLANVLPTWAEVLGDGRGRLNPRGVEPSVFWNPDLLEQRGVKSLVVRIHF